MVSVEVEAGNYFLGLRPPSRRDLKVDIAPVEPVEIPVRGELSLNTALPQDIAPGEAGREILKLMHDLPAIKPGVRDVDPSGTVADLRDPVLEAA